MINAILNYTFMQNALLGAILASILTGIIGSIIVEKKLVMLSSGIAHSSFGGIGLGYMLGFDPIYGAFMFSIFSALLIPTIDKKTNTGSDNLIAIIWSFGMALGILFISFTKGYPPDMSSYLFGNILTISTANLYIMLAVTIIVVSLFTTYYNHWKVYLFDSEFAFIIGIKTNLMDYILYVLIGISVVAMVKMVGIILIIALLSIPPSISKFYVTSFKSLILHSIFWGLFLTISGLIVSYYFNIPSGATIIILSVIIYSLSALYKNKFTRNKKTDTD